MGGDSGEDAPQCFGLTFPLLVSHTVLLARALTPALKAQYYCMRLLQWQLVTALLHKCCLSCGPARWAACCVSLHACRLTQRAASLASPLAGPSGCQPRSCRPTSSTSTSSRCVLHGGCDCKEKGSSNMSALGLTCWARLAFPLPSPQIHPVCAFPTLQVTDADVIKFLRMLTFLPLEEIDAMEQAMGKPDYAPNTAQKLLAEAVTRWVSRAGLAQHGRPAGRSAAGRDTAAASGRPTGQQCCLGRPAYVLSAVVTRTPATQLVTQPAHAAASQLRL